MRPKTWLTTNNRNFYYRELCYTATTTCLLVEPCLTLYTQADKRIACWHENEINKFQLTGRRSFFFHPNDFCVDRWSAGLPQDRTTAGLVRECPDELNFKRPWAWSCVNVVFVVAGPRIHPLILLISQKS